MCIRDRAAAQFGTKKQVADAESKVIATAFETIDIAAGTAVKMCIRDRDSPSGELYSSY